MVVILATIHHCAVNIVLQIISPATEYDSIETDDGTIDETNETTMGDHDIADTPPRAAIQYFQFQINHAYGMDLEEAGYENVLQFL